MYISYLKKKQVNKDSFIKELEVTLILHNTQYAKTVAEIFQLAKAFRVKEIIITGDSVKPPFGKDLSKASQGEEKHVKWSTSEDVMMTIQTLKKQGYKIFSLDYAEESKSIYNTEVKGQKLAFVIGNESTGLSREVISKIDNTYYIPNYLNSGVLSTNLAVSIILSMIFFKKKI